MSIDHLIAALSDALDELDNDAVTADRRGYQLVRDLYIDEMCRFYLAIQEIQNQLWRRSGLYHLPYEPATIRQLHKERVYGELFEGFNKV